MSRFLSPPAWGRWGREHWWSAPTRPRPRAGNPHAEHGYPASRLRDARPGTAARPLIAPVHFTGWVDVSGSAGNLGHIQLFNPAGSNRRVEIHRVRVQGDVTSFASLRRDDVQRATLRFRGIGLGHLHLASVCELRNEVAPAAIGTLIGIVLISASRDAPVAEMGVSRLAPGQGLTFVNETAGQAMVVIADWAEADL